MSVSGNLGMILGCPVIGRNLDRFEVHQRRKPSYSSYKDICKKITKALPHIAYLF